MNSNADTRTPATPLSVGTSAATSRMCPEDSKVILRVHCPTPPAFKNAKRSILDKNSGLQRTLTPGKIKRRMDQLENAIVSALYSLSQTGGAVTPSECSKQLRTVLSGLCDDSLKQIPAGAWGTEYVNREDEGLVIIIEQIFPDIAPAEAAAAYAAAHREVLEDSAKVSPNLKPQ